MGKCTISGRNSVGHFYESTTYQENSDFTYVMISEKERIFKKSRSCSMDVEEAGLYVTLGGRTKLKFRYFITDSPK